MILPSSACFPSNKYLFPLWYYQVWHTSLQIWSFFGCSDKNSLLSLAGYPLDKYLFQFRWNLFVCKQRVAESCSVRPVLVVVVIAISLAVNWIQFVARLVSEAYLIAVQVCLVGFGDRFLWVSAWLGEFCVWESVLFVYAFSLFFIIQIGSNFLFIRCRLLVLRMH